MGIKDTGRLLTAAGQAWVKDNAPRLGAALSYYTIFAISPLLVLVIFVTSLLFDRASVHNELFGQLREFIGAQAAETLQKVLSASAPKTQGVIASVIAGGTLLVTSTGLFIELQSALNTIFGVEEKPGQGIRGFLLNRVLSFAMVFVIGFLLLVSLALTAATEAISKYVGSSVPGMDLFWTLMNTAVAFLVVMLLFGMVFKVLPDVRIAWRDVWVGAAVTALLFTIGKYLLGLYLGRNSAVSAYGAAGSVVLVLLWVYYSSQILFFGAEVTQVYANRYGSRLEPKAHARWKPCERPAAIDPPDHNVSRDEPTPRDRRRAELVCELRQKVDELRTVARQSKRPRSAE